MKHDRDQGTEAKTTTKNLAEGTETWKDEEPACGGK